MDQSIYGLIVSDSVGDVRLKNLLYRRSKSLGIVVRSSAVGADVYSISITVKFPPS